MFLTQMATAGLYRFRSVLTFSFMCAVLLAVSATTGFAQFTPRPGLLG
jgi:hypothetical protein